MSSLAVGRGLEGLELWLAGLFSAAELAAADLLLQLSADKGVDGDEAAALSATESTSPRSATPGGDCEDITVDDEEEEEAKVEEEEVEAEEERVFEKPAASTELDRRARKRYRRLSDLYAATSPVTSASTDAKKKKRKRHRRRDNDGFGSSSSSEEATRYGGDY
uniref:Uncharacterized protein n=1 Tax=Avena sativa TaxID=4498 RepID=A0ACD5YDP2_AVESA